MKVYPLCVTLYFLLLVKSSDLYSHLMYVILVKVFCDFFDVLLLKRRAPIVFSYNYQSLSIINKHLFSIYGLGNVVFFLVLFIICFFDLCPFGCLFFIVIWKETNRVFLGHLSEFVFT